MPRTQIYAPDVRAFSPATPFVISWQASDGFHVAMGRRIPSIRADILKVTLINITDGKETALKLEERPDRSLTDGKEVYRIYAPTDLEVETMARKLKDLGV